jgi:uncharacterized protein YegP (UPF0339 family)
MNQLPYKFHTYLDRHSEWRWRLIAGNGEIVADSAEGYSSLDAVRQAARRVKDNAARAPID